jgi:H+/Cl- antiporter ClcA
VLAGTIVTHLFGGSAGREGTAIQMGGSIASTVGRLLDMDAANTRRLLMAGVAAGFGAVFGTPITGAIFAMEVLAIGRMSYEGLIPCLIASTLADWVCTRWHIVHTDYHKLLPAPKVALDGLDAVLFGKVILAGAAFGLASVVFAELTHGIQRLCKTFIAWPPLRPAIGGVLVIGLTFLIGTRSYLGLGVTSPDARDVTIVTCFVLGGATALSWWWKSLFTAVTVGSGFKGGEVTPLFFVGAALGNSLSRLMGAPTDLFAALGFVGVFAGATNTPLACTIMGIELFGHSYAVYIATACFMAYLFSGHSGIYLSQRIGVPKMERSGVEPDASLRSAREQHPPVIRLPGVGEGLRTED